MQRIRDLVRPRGWLRLPQATDADIAVKPRAYLPVYEELLGRLRWRACTILELGVWNGDSLAMWRDALPRATVVGIDLVPPDVELGPRVHIVAGDQTDGDLMARVRQQFAPGGFDVIIDDASHIGITSARSLQVLFADHLKAGGLYCLEDWGTGYVPDWHDGAPPAETVSAAGIDGSPSVMTADERTPIHLPSHDIGMVGLVKRLVDHVAAGSTLAHHAPDKIDAPLAIQSMRVYDGVVALRKASQ